MRSLLCRSLRLTTGSEEEGFQYSYLETYYDSSTKAIVLVRTELSMETMTIYTRPSGDFLDSYCSGTNLVTVTSNGACGINTDSVPSGACGFVTCNVTLIDFASTNESAFQAEDGTVTAVAESNQAGTLVYQLVNSDGDTFTNTTGNFTGLPPSNYVLNVSQATNSACNTTFNFRILRYACSVTIDDPIVVVPASSVAKSDGSISATTSGALGSVQYSLFRFNTQYRAPQSTGLFENLPSGTYVLLVEDLGDAGCTTSKQVFVDANSATALSIADGFCGKFFLAKNYTPYIAIDQILNVSDPRVFNEINPPAGWESVEINDERSENHGFKQSFSTDELKFGCDNGRPFLVQAKNERGSDANVKIIFGYYDEDEDFIVIEASNLNFNEYFDDGDFVSLPLIAQEFDGLLETNYNMEQEIAPNKDVYIPPAVLREAATIDYDKQRLNALLLNEQSAPEGTGVGYYIPNWNVQKTFKSATISTYPAQLTYVDPTKEVANQTTSKPILTVNQRGRYKVRFNIAIQAYVPLIDPVYTMVNDFLVLTDASITIYNQTIDPDDIQLLSNYVDPNTFLPVPYTVRNINTVAAKSDVDWRAYLRQQLDPFDKEPTSVASDVIQTHVIELESDWLYMREGAKVMFSAKFSDGVNLDNSDYQSFMKGVLGFGEEAFLSPTFVHSVKSAVLIGDTEPTQLVDGEAIPIIIFGDTLNSPSVVKAINLKDSYKQIIANVTKVEDIGISELLNTTNRLGERTYLFTEGGIKNNFITAPPRLILSMENFVNNLKVLLNTGIGVEVVPTASLQLQSVPPSPFLPTLRIEDMDYFYTDREVVAITNISDFERRFDSSLLFSKIDVGFSNYQKARENYGLAAESDIHTKYVYETPLQRFNNTLDLNVDWTFSNQLIERARLEGKENPAGSSMKFDNNIMGVVTVEPYPVYPLLFTVKSAANELTIDVMNSSDVTYVPRYMPIVPNDTLTLSYPPSDGSSAETITVQTVVYDFANKIIITFPEQLKSPLTTLSPAPEFPQAYITYTLTTTAAQRRVPEAFETFPVEFISGAYDNYAVYNLRFTPKRILLNNSNFFNASFKFKEPYEIIELKTKDNDIDFSSRFKSSADPDINGDTAVRTLQESRSLTIGEGYNGTSPLSCEVVSFKCKLPFSTINFIRRAYRGAVSEAQAIVNYGYLNVTTPDGNVKIFPKSLVYNISQGILSVEGWVVGTAIEPNPANIKNIVDETFSPIVYGGQEDYWVWDL
jgi:hypothetical protein